MNPFPVIPGLDLGAEAETDLPYLRAVSEPARGVRQ